MKTAKPLIDPDGEVRELDDSFFKKARPGRPPVPAEKRKKRINLMLDPDVIAGLRARGNMSALVNRILREKLGL